MIASNSLFAQEKHYTNMLIEGYGNLKIGTVLDILAENTSKFIIWQDTHDNINGLTTSKQVNLMPELGTLIATFQKQSYLDKNEFETLLYYVVLAQSENILVTNEKSTPVEQSLQDLVKYQKSTSTSMAVIATTNVIAIVGAVIGILISSK